MSDKNIHILKTYNINDLENEINKYLLQGYNLYGELNVIPINSVNNEYIYHQIMIKNDIVRYNWSDWE